MDGTHVDGFWRRGGEGPDVSVRVVSEGERTMIRYFCLGRSFICSIVMFFLFFSSGLVTNEMRCENSNLNNVLRFMIFALMAVISYRTNVDSSRELIVHGE